MLARLAGSSTPGRAAPPAGDRRRARAVRRSTGATAAVFVNYARYWHEMFRLGPGSGEELQRTFELRGGEHLDGGDRDGPRRDPRLAAPRELGRGGRVAGRAPGHPGPHGRRRAGRAPGALRLVRVERARPSAWRSSPLGPDGGSGRARALGRGHVVCLVCDRDLGRRRHRRSSSSASGPRCRPARRRSRCGVGAPLLPSAAFWRDDGGHGTDIGRPLVVERAGRLRDDVARVTQDLALRFEALIRAAPEQWLMMQPNWPSDELPDRPIPGQEARS